MKRHKFLVLKVASAYPVPVDQPTPYTVDPTQNVRAACNLDSMKNLEDLAVGEIVYNYRQCFQKAGYDFDKSILHFAADYGNNPQSFNDPRRMVSGMTIGLPVHAIAAQAQQKEDDLRRYFPADEVAAIAQVSKAASIASSLDDPDVKITAELLTQNGYKPTDGAIASLKMTTSHELGRIAFEIDAPGNISQR